MVARYKVIKPTFENPLLKRAKKRERIRNAVFSGWGVLMLVAVCVMGLYQDKDAVVGWGLILSGLVVCLPTAIFSIYTYCKGGEVLSRIDFFLWEEHGIAPGKETGETMRDDRIVSLLLTAVILGMAVILPMLGVVKLFSVM